MSTATRPPSLVAACQRQGVVLALAAGELIGEALLRVSRWASLRSAHERQRHELAATPESAARDLGIDVALLRQAPGLASSALWRPDRRR